MKTLLTIATVALAAAAFAAGPKEGRGPMQRGPRGGMGMEGPGDPVVRMVTNPKVAEKIGLTDEQRDKIKEINKANRESAKDLQEKHREAMKKQAELLKADKVDEAAVMAEIDKAFEVRKELAKRQTRRVIAIKAVLTPEQVKKMLEMAKEFKGRPMGDPEARGQNGKGPKGEGCGKPCEGPKCKDGDKPCNGPKCKDGDKPCNGPKCKDGDKPCEGQKCKDGGKPCKGPKCKDGDRPEPPPEAEGDDMPEEV